MTHSGHLMILSNLIPTVIAYLFVQIQELLYFINFLELKETPTWIIFLRCFLESYF